jgi:hypothetical protein
MSARTLVYRAMAFAPAVFLIGIGARGRTFSTDYNFVANDPCTERRIQAYVPYLRKYPSFVTSGRFGDLGLARAAAASWIEGAGRGDLKPLAPICYDDTSSDGGKSTIFEFEAKVANRLEFAITEEVKQGNYHEAATDSLLVIGMSSILKYSDFFSVYHCASEQRRVVLFIEEIAGHLTPDDRRALSTALSQVTTDQATIATMIGRQQEFFIGWRAKSGFQPLSIEDTQLLSDIPALAQDGSLVAMHELRSRVLASKDNHLPAYCSSLRLGVGAQDRVDQDARRLRKQLDSMMP